MNKAKKILYFALCAMLVSSLAACGQTEKDKEEVLGPALPAPVLGGPEIISATNEIEITENVTEDNTVTENATRKNALTKTNVKIPSNASGRYTFMLGENGLVHVFVLQTKCFTWSYVAENGDMVTVPSSNRRPCDAENPQSVKLGEPDDGIIEISLPHEEILESYTITAYPIGNYESGIACELVDGKLTLLEDARYYEIVVAYTQGTATYGFFTE